MNIYFVRHGQSEENISDIMAQSPEGKLSDLGRKQAEFVSKRFLTIPVDIIVSSSHTRAQETSQIINTKLHKEVLLSDLLIETKFPSKLLGKPLHDPEVKEIRSLLRQNYHTLARHSDEEDFKDLKKRAAEALEYISSLPYENVLVVTHGMFLRFLIAHMIFGEQITAHEFINIELSLKTKNTGISFVEYVTPNPKYDLTDPKIRKWKIHAWNDHAHLGEVKE